MGNGVGGKIGYVRKKTPGCTERKKEREIAELESVKVEDERHTAQLNKMVETLEGTLESYKRRAVEAEQLADHNLGMFRRRQQELEEVETRLREGNEELSRLQKK